MPRLVFKKNHQEVFSYNVNQNTTLMGRAPNCHVVLPDADISREQVGLYKIDDKYFVKKLGKAVVFIEGKSSEFGEIKLGQTFTVGAWQVAFSEGGDIKDDMAETIVQATPTANHDLVSSLVTPSVRYSVFELCLRDKGHVIAKKIIDKNVLTLGAVKGDIKLAKLQDNYKLVLEDSLLTCINSKAESFILKAGEIHPLEDLELELICREADETLSATKVDHFFGLVGKNEKMQNLYSMIARVAKSDAAVLALGESGTGKELVAKAIHMASARSTKPFVALNCGAISKELIESELFGHEKGAFTGAQQQRAGAFEFVQDGTLFLDEIGELSLELQPKLLRVLESRVFKRVGGNQDLQSRCRVLAATHRDLPAMVKAGKFREDLFFRLFVLPLYIPPLRERVQDISLLVDNFLIELGGGKKAKKISVAALKKLEDYPWPGNVRELRNLIQRAYVMCSSDCIEDNDLLFMESYQSSGVPLSDHAISPVNLESNEKELILQALERCRGNKRRAAEQLGIARSTLFKKLHYYGIPLNDQDA